MPLDEASARATGEVNVIPIAIRGTRAPSVSTTMPQMASQRVQVAM